MWTRSLKIKEQPSNKPIYTLKFTSALPGFSMVIATIDTDAVVAAAKVSLFRNTTELVLGDPSSNGKAGGSKRVEMKFAGIWKHNHYVLSLPLPGGGQGSTMDLEWKGTNDVDGFMKKMDRGLHQKLVVAGSESGSGSGGSGVLAKYVHDSYSMDVAGTVEIFENAPEGVGMGWREWDSFVLVSVLAVVDKTISLMKTAM